MRTAPWIAAALALAGGGALAQTAPSLPSFSALDADGDGVVSRYEFNTYMSGAAYRPTGPLASADATTEGRAATKVEPRYPFEALDANQDNALTKQELIRVLPGLAAGFDLADRNNDGRLNRPEYEEARALSADFYGHGERAAHKREIFRSLDMDGDRFITPTEAKWRPEIAAQFAAIDRDHDGRISAGEFGRLTIVTLAASERPLDEVPAAAGRTHQRFSFAELDLNNDGRIARTEAAFRQDLVRNFSQADRDGDGSLSLEEFVAWSARQ